MLLVACSPRNIRPNQLISLYRKMHRPTVIVRRHRHPNILTRVLQVQHMCTTQSKPIKQTSWKHARFRSFPKCTRRVVSYHRLPDDVKIRLQISFTLYCPRYRWKTLPEAYCIRVCPSVSEWESAWVSLCVSKTLWTPHLKNQWREFHQIFVTDV